MKLQILFETDEIVREPSGWFKYKNEDYPYWGSLTGATKTLNYDVGKFNRFAKLGEDGNWYRNYFVNMIKEDNKHLDARCSYACLLMMDHGIRVGNESSAEGYESGLEDNEGEEVQTFGVSTLINDHITSDGVTLELDFLGKTQVEHNIIITDPAMVKLGNLYQKINFPVDTWLGINYDILFGFIKNHVGAGYIPKDFRTFCANITAWDYIKDKIKKVDTITDANNIIKDMVEHTAGTLGNTTGVCKSSYLDSKMIDWLKDQMVE